MSQHCGTDKVAHTSDTIPEKLRPDPDKLLLVNAAS